jgi:hypothetical protein
VPEGRFVVGFEFFDPALELAYAGAARLDRVHIDVCATPLP